VAQQAPHLSDAHTSSTNGSRRCTDWSKERGGSVKRSKQEAGNQSITLGAAGQGRAGVRACGGRRWGKSSKARGAGLSCLCFILPAAAASSSSSSHRSPPRAPPPHIIRRGEHMLRAAIRRGLLPCPPVQLLRWPSNFKLSPAPDPRCSCHKKNCFFFPSASAKSSVVVAFRFPASPEIGKDSEKGEKYMY
jgi:hypothetical protein